jgi:hypothetical protein
MGLILEACKMGFAYESLSNTRLNLFIRVSLGVIAILLIISSILASAGYIQNQANKTLNTSILKSNQYKQQEQAKKLQQELYEAKKQDIADTKQSYQKQVADMQKVKDNYPSNYLTRKENLQAEINAKLKELQQVTDKKNVELESIAVELNKPIETKSISIVDDKGYRSMFILLADKLNAINDTTDYKPEALEFYFYVILSIIFECVAVLTSFLAMLKTSPSLSPHVAETLTTPSITHNKIIPINKQVIGFKPEPKPRNIDDNILEKYYTHMINTARNNISMGYKSIGSSIGIDTEMARMCKRLLEEQGKIKTVGNRTVIQA